MMCYGNSKVSPILAEKYTATIANYVTKGGTVIALANNGNETKPAVAIYCSTDSTTEKPTGRLCYALAEPTNAPLDADTLAAYAALHTYKPNTTIYNDAGAYMAAEYVADTKTYVDKKIDSATVNIVKATVE
jgi:hypothetical protein